MNKSYNKTKQLSDINILSNNKYKNATQHRLIHSNHSQTAATTQFLTPTPPFSIPLIIPLPLSSNSDLHINGIQNLSKFLNLLLLILSLLLALLQLVLHIHHQVSVVLELSVCPDDVIFSVVNKHLHVMQ